MKTMQMLTASTLALVIGLSAGNAGAKPSASPPADATLTADTVDLMLVRDGVTVMLDKTCPRPARATKQGAEEAAKEAVRYKEAVAADLDCRLRVVSRLADAFRVDARSNQRWSDVGAGISAVSMTGFAIAASGGASASVQSLWSLGAASPVLVNDLGAPSHRGMLYMTAANGLDLAASRYTRLAGALDALETFSAGRPDAQMIAVRCTELRRALSLVKAQKDDSRRTTVMAALESMIARCDASVAASRGLAAYAYSIAAERARLSRRLSEDAQMIVVRRAELDRALRAGPLESVRTAAATPFLTLGNLLKGDNKPFNGRADPRENQDYAVTMTAFVQPTPVPDAVPGETLYTPAAQQAIEELQKGNDALAGINVTMSSLSDELPAWAALLNAERLAALRVAAADGERKFSLDPRRTPPAAAKTEGATAK